MRSPHWFVRGSRGGSLVAPPVVSILRAVLPALLVGAALGLSGCGEDPGNTFLRTKVGVGDEAPPSRNRTVADPADWHQISTMDTKVDLYRWVIADLLDASRPFLVVFGTPQHCTMCVDQIVRVQIMQEKHGDRFAFIHVDGYKDNPVWVEWGVTGEPWTFMVDARGKVRKVFPGQTEIGLLEDEMHRLLKDAA